MESIRHQCTLHDVTSIPAEEKTDWNICRDQLIVTQYNNNLCRKLFQFIETLYKGEIVVRDIKQQRSFSPL